MLIHVFTKKRRQQYQNTVFSLIKVDERIFPRGGPGVVRKGGSRGAMVVPANGPSGSLTVVAAPRAGRRTRNVAEAGRGPFVTDEVGRGDVLNGIL